MKKWILIFSILIVGTIGLMYGVFKTFESADEAKKTSGREEVSKVEEFKEQTKKIGGVTVDLGLDSTPEEHEVISVMHQMTHQKVKADNKWGAKPMIPDSIDSIYNIILKSDFSRKDDLLAIAERWKNGDFSRADDDHNYFWNYQNGTIGKAYGLMNEAEEKEFIINNFGEEFLPQ
ncbi:DUF6241 domain-containing protein [Ferdinandcohnia sp. Marseille-Q9671]